LPPLIDPIRLEAYQDALRNWSFSGYVHFELTETAIQWVKREFPNTSLREIGRLMHEYVATGGEIDEVRETRPLWSGRYEYHHDLRFTVHGKRVYIETRLRYPLPFVPDDSSILVVNIHAP
jgi:hypothetical protein